MTFHYKVRNLLLWYYNNLINLYGLTFFNVSGIEQYCWKCSEVKTEPFKVKDETLSIDDQPESDSVSHHQSDVLETSSVKLKRSQCNVCNKTFPQKSALNRHIREVHDKVKPFECPHCPNKAGTNSNIKQHILNQTAEKS